MNHTSSANNSVSSTAAALGSMNSKARGIVAAAVAATALSLSPQQAAATPVTASMSEVVPTTLISTQGFAHYRFIDGATDILTGIGLPDGTGIEGTGTYAPLPATAFEDLANPLHYADISFTDAHGTWRGGFDITGQRFDEYGLAYLTYLGIDVAYGAGVGLDGRAVDMYWDGARVRFTRDTYPTSSVPEPGSLALMTLAGLGLAATRRKNGKGKVDPSDV